MTTAEDPRIAQLLDAIATTAPGHTTTWTNSGIEVTVYGQRRYELHTPTPWAVITIAGRIRPIHTWQQLLNHVDAPPHLLTTVCEGFLVAGGCRGGVELAFSA